MHRSLPIDSTQGIRKRTRVSVLVYACSNSSALTRIIENLQAGMGHCQGDKDNYNCECRVAAIIARENDTDPNEVGRRPWPATSTLTGRWISDSERSELEERMTVAQ